jgi:hypothetical protein
VEQSGYFGFRGISLTTVVAWFPGCNQGGVYPDNCAAGWEDVDELAGPVPGMIGLPVMMKATAIKTRMTTTTIPIIALRCDLRILSRGTFCRD